MKIKTYQPIISDRQKLTRLVADFWNRTTESWTVIWGPHFHHGYYEPDLSISRLEAQENLIDKLTELLTINPNMSILDVGCGIGGSSIYLATHHHVNVTGVTLSEKQVSMAKQSAQTNKINSVTFKLEDALALDSIANDSFDIVWSLESCEQFYDKHLFLRQAYRVLKPGGHCMIATWCSDRDEYEGAHARDYRTLCQVFDLPYMPTMDYYHHQLEMCGFQLLKQVDWSQHVMKSWDIGLSLLSVYNLFQLFKMGGLRGLRLAKQVKLMRDAFYQNRVRYGVFIAKKPM